MAAAAFALAATLAGAGEQAAARADIPTFSKDAAPVLYKTRTAGSSSKCTAAAA